MSNRFLLQALPPRRRSNYRSTAPKHLYLAFVAVAAFTLVESTLSFGFCSNGGLEPNVRTSTCLTRRQAANTDTPAAAAEEVSIDTMISNGARRMSSEAVATTKMYVASRNGRILNWSNLLRTDSCLATSEAAARCDDGIHPSPMDAMSFLKLLPRGAYTTCRTIERGTSVYQFEYHVNRMASSCASMIAEGVLPEGKDALDPVVYNAVTNVDQVRTQTMECIKNTVAEFRLQYNNRMFPCDEFKITLLQTWLPDANSGAATADDAAMYCHVGILPKRRDGQHIRVEVHGHGRKNAAAKDSQWINEREDSAEHGCEEYILVNDDGQMLEGTQTNFFLVTNQGCVLTADEGILRGSVRDSVLRVCAENDIPLELRPPNVNDLQHASGAFLSSTSRLVLPIHEVVVNVSEEDVAGTPPKPATFSYPNCQTTKTIQKLVLEDVKTHCVSIV